MIVDEKVWDELSNYRASLEHHNVKGSSWYKHKFGRFQKHAKYAIGVSDPDEKKVKKEKHAEEKKAKKDAKAKAKSEAEAAKKEAERREILSSPKKLYKHRKEFTYDEIRSAMDTFKWERELKGYSESTIKKGSDFVKDMVGLTNNGINLYNAAARVVNSVSGDGVTNKIPFIGSIDASKNKRKGQKKDDD